MTAVQFDAPGPGFWEWDAVHLPRPITRYWAETHPEPFKRGSHELHRLRAAARHDLLAGTSTASATRPPAGPDEEVPARFARAEEAIDGKLWREQLRDWDKTFKPAVDRDAPRAAVGRHRTRSPTRTWPST